MADTQTSQDTTPSPDIASLVGGSSDKGLIEGLVGLDKAKVAEDRAITTAADKRMTQDQSRLDAAFKAEGVSAAELPRPWNADAEHKKYESNPIEGFGSIGGLFAVIASAFTKAPMENAINGMAGAINSIKDGNEAAYQRAYGAWKDNTKLAMDRFRMQHDIYSDAMSLFDHDTTAANAKLHNAAVRFGDNQMLALAEHGMVKEMFELQEARNRSAAQMLELSEKMDEHAFTKTALTAMQRGFQSTGDANKDKLILATQALKILKKGGQVGTAEQEAIGQYVMTHQPTDPQFAAGLADLHQKFSPKAANVQGYQDARQQIIDSEGSISPEKDAELLQKFGLTGRPGATGAGSMSSQANKTKAIDEIIAEHKAKGEDISRADAEGEYNRRRSAPSGNRLDDLNSKINQTEHIIDTSNKQLDFLRQYKGGAGVMGKIMRGEEIASNIVGAGTQSDRVEFRRRVHELQEMVPRILTDASGRPLKSAQDKVDDIVAGLNAGDTGANTIRAYEELVKEMQERQREYVGRRDKPVSGATTHTQDQPATGNTDWLNAYPEKK